MNQTQYERVKERARRVSALNSLAGRDIAPLPPVVDYRRRVEASDSLKAFCLTYFPNKFKKPFGKHHLALIEALENVVNFGGKQAVAMPRGSGKTTIATAAAVWALVTGRRRFVVIVAANTKEARKLLKSIVTVVGETPALLEDFPEICEPVRRLKGSALLARGQLFYGVPTNVQISADQFRFPTVPGSPASGSVVAAYGVKAALRGLTAEGADGSTVRPDLLFLDDLQTDQIANNPRRVADLEEIVASAVEGLVENGVDVAAFQTCTVKRPDDYADRVLNREISPRWNGLRFASLESFPTRIDLWREYRAKWFSSESEATAFYRKNRKAMQEGAVVTWPEAYVNDGKSARRLDALEFYMAKWCENERAFWSEQQNQPMEAGTGSVRLTAKDIKRKINGYARGAVPESAVKLTAAVDVHADILYYAVAAWDEDFTGRVIDYGTFPKQKRAYFSKNDGGLETLKREFPGATAEGRLYSGLTALLGELVSTLYEVDGGAAPARHVDRILVDSGWKQETVENAIRSVDPRACIPCKGVAVGAKKTPMKDWPKRRGRFFGWHMIDEKTANATLRSFLVDVNYWKTVVHESFALAPGEPGSLSLWGTSQNEHRMFAEHMAAESAKLVESASNKVVEWSPNVNRPDNHFFDCVVYCYAAASSLGIFSSRSRADLSPRPR